MESRASCEIPRENRWASEIPPPKGWLNTLLKPKIMGFVLAPFSTGDSEFGSHDTVCCPSHAPGARHAVSGIIVMKFTSGCSPIARLCRFLGNVVRGKQKYNTWKTTWKTNTQCADWSDWSGEPLWWHGNPFDQKRRPPWRQRTSGITWFRGFLLVVNPIIHHPFFGMMFFATKIRSKCCVCYWVYHRQFMSITRFFTEMPSHYVAMLPRWIWFGHGILSLNRHEQELGAKQYVGYINTKSTSKLCISPIKTLT